MRKNVFCLLFLGVLTASLAVMDVQAETSYGGSDWRVTFTSEKKMESSFKTSDINDTIYGMQPGDNAIIELALKNENSATTDWYMSNKVLYSLEDRSANSGTSGGAYTYRLVYTDKSGTATTLFDSDTVGGEQVNGGREGLHEATAALEDYFYLDTLKTGESGRIMLEVALDGETQGNDYQNTLADLEMNFAVELHPDTPGDSNTPGRTTSRTDTSDQDTSRTSRRTSVVRTGDESRLTLFTVLSAVSGLMFLLLSLYGALERQKEKKEEQ